MIQQIKIHKNTIALTDKEQTIYIDPVGINDSPHDADAIFITQNGSDHYSLEDIMKVSKEETKLIVPSKIYETLKKNDTLDMNYVIEAKTGTFREYNQGEQFEVLPAHNKIKLFRAHKEEWCSYLIYMSEGKCYIPGEADDISDTTKIQCDAIIFNLESASGLKGKEAAELTNRIKPDKVVVYGKSQYDIFGDEVSDKINVYFVTEE